MKNARYNFKNWTDPAQALVRASMRGALVIYEKYMGGVETSGAHYEHELDLFKERIDDPDMPMFEFRVMHFFRGKSFERQAGFSIDLLLGGADKRSTDRQDIYHEVAFRQSSMSRDLGTAQRHIILLQVAAETAQRLSNHFNRLDEKLNALIRNDALVDPEKVSAYEKTLQKKRILAENCSDIHARTYFCNELAPAFIENGLEETLEIKIPSGKPRRWLKALDKIVITNHVRGKESKLILTHKGREYLTQTKEEIQKEA